MKRLHGTGVALVTPFTKDLEVDYKGLKKLLRHTAKGVDYYVVMGTTGESATVNFREKKEILQFVKENNPAGLPIVYGIGGNNTQSVLEGIKSSELDGIDAILSVSSYYNKPSQEGIYQHFRAIARASPVPVILYNVPGRTGSNITAETTIRLSKLSNIIGIKEASGSIEQCLKIGRSAAPGFMLLSGDDLLTVPLYSIGSVGVISVLANALPVPFKKMKEHAFSGNFRKATTEQTKIVGINSLMYEEGNPVGVKQLLMELGVCENHVRLPNAPASPALQKKIKQALSELKK